MKKNQIALLIILLVQSFVVMSCSAKTNLIKAQNLNTNLSSYSSMINRYQLLKTDFEIKHNVNIENIVRYRALRFISAGFWDANKVRINYLPWMAYGRRNTKKEIIDPDPKVWMYWERGDYYSKHNLKSTVRNYYFTMDHIKNLHKNIVDVSIMSKFSVVRKGARPGKLRSNIFQKAPGWSSKCKKYPMKGETLNHFNNYDLRTSEGEPLVVVKKSKRCKKKPGYHSVKIRYLESSDVPEELQRLLNFINNKWENIANGTDRSLTPIEFIADVQRWFVSIHPFGDGNGRTSRVIQDVIAKSFGLPYPPSGYLTNDITLSKYDYRIEMKKKMNLMMSELETCMAEYDQRASNIGFMMNADCSQIYLPIGNTTKRYSKRIFKKYLDRFLRVNVDGLEDFFEENPIPQVD